MTTLYEVCLWVGAIWFAIVFLLGEIGDGLGDMDIPGFHPTWIPSFRSLILGGVFFGGAGLILGNQMPELSGQWQFICAGFTGLIVGLGFEFGCYRPLKRYDALTCISTEDLVGMEATVTLPIRESKAGTIKVQHPGGVLTYAARGQENQVFERQDVVIIEEIVGHTVIVSAKPDATNTEVFDN